METKAENRVMKNQTDFSAMGPTIFELWVMKTELWVMETQNANTPNCFFFLNLTGHCKGVAHTLANTLQNNDH